jgi:hypothetical protein
MQSISPNDTKPFWGLPGPRRHGAAGKPKSQGKVDNTNGDIELQTYEKILSIIYTEF